MRVLLVAMGRKSLQPMLGLAYLAGYLQAKGTVPKEAIRVADLNTAQNPLRILRKHKPDLIGVSTTTTHFAEALALAPRLRKAAPDAVMVLGGPHITALPESLPPEFDLGVVGEGEETFRQLIEMLSCRGRDYASIPGLAWRDNDGALQRSEERAFIEDLDSLPFPARDLYDMRFYAAPKQTIRGVFSRATQLMTARGCPFDCSYCASALLWKRCVRFFSPDYMMREIRSLHEKYGVNSLYMQDDQFPADVVRLREFVERKNSEPWSRDIVYSAQLRASHCDEEVVALLRESGCIQVEFGFESGSQRVLESLKGQGARVEQHSRAAELVHKAGIRILGNFVFGAPEETEEDVRETLHFIRSNPIDFVSSFVLTPYPGTSIWRDYVYERYRREGLDWRRFDMVNGNRGNLLVAKHLSLEDVQHAIAAVRAETNKRFYQHASSYARHALPERVVHTIFGDNWERYVPYRLAILYKKYVT